MEASAQILEQDKRRHQEDNSTFPGITMHFSIRQMQNPHSKYSTGIKEEYMVRDANSDLFPVNYLQGIWKQKMWQQAHTAVRLKTHSQGNGDKLDDASFDILNVISVLWEGIAALRSGQSFTVPMFEE